MNGDPGDRPVDRSSEYLRDKQEQLLEVLGAVAAADQAVLEVYQSANAGEFNLKADGSEVTRADLASSAILVAALERLFPGVPVVSEEGDEAANRIAVTTDRFWLVDPVDGTKEFLQRSGEFSVCLALVENGRPTFGIVSAPALGVTYFGGPGFGSFRQHNGITEPIAVAGDKGIVFASRSNFDPATAAYIADNYSGCEVYFAGSQLKLPYIAEGRGDSFPRLNSRLCLWDLAPGEAILTGAGGSVSRFDGTPIDYRQPSLRVGDFIARNK